MRLSIAAKLIAATVFILLMSMVPVAYMTSEKVKGEFQKREEASNRQQAEALAREPGQSRIKCPMKSSR